MERVLNGLQPKRVFEIFEDLTQIPHGSGNVKEISDYCYQFAKNLGLQTRQDETYNVVIVKEASKGYPSDKTVMLQGHMDMVCEKNQDNPINMDTDPLNIGIDGDFIHANGTTLGADNGVAVAYALAILEDDTLEHPRLEIVLTTEEETGMDGARELDVSDLKATYLINLDSELEGEILTSCAGGNKTTVRLPIQRERMEGLEIEILVRGLQGGHSGAEIHTGKANSNLLLGRILNELSDLSIGIVSIEGGMKDNAIPREAQATVLIPKEQLEQVEKIVKNVEREVKKEYEVTDPNISFSVVTKGETKKDVMTKESGKRCISYLLLVINGIQGMSFEIENLVESSLNLGVMTTSKQEVAFVHAIRSSKLTKKTYMKKQVEMLGNLLGGTVEFRSDYPAWEYRRDSKLRELCVDKYEELTGNKATIQAIHAGLECGILSEKMPQLDMVAIGPNMYGIHTPDEKLSIASTKRVYEYLLLVLKDFYQYIK